MKTTAQRLSKFYCRPNNSEWVDLIGYVPNRDTATYAVYDGELGVIDANESEVTYLTEVQSSHFIDLLQDKIVPWRLEEDGFIEKHLGTCTGYHFIMNNGVVVEVTSGLCVSVIESNEDDETDHILFQGCTTYTDLLTLIKLIG